jgi:outer membrane lipoprotein SlyB
MLRKVFVLAACAALSLGGCMWTDSQGNQVVLTVQNATPLVVDKIKQVCAVYDANKVTIDGLTQVATQAINNETVSGAAKTVTEIATAACPLLEALIKTESAAK